MAAGKLFKLRSTFSNPASAGAYSAGDEISSNATAGSVVRATFDLTGFTRGRIVAAALDITPASGNFVIVAANMEMFIFKTPDTPAAVGDNVTNPIAAATRATSIGIWTFDDGAWLNQLGALAAGTSGYQEIPAQIAVGLATPELQRQHVPGHPFDFTGQKLTQRELTVVLNALAAWTPGAVINAFGITLHIEAD